MGNVMLGLRMDVFINVNRDGYTDVHSVTLGSFTFQPNMTSNPAIASRLHSNALAGRVAELGSFGIMKPFASISLLLLLVAGCVSNRSVQSDAYFLPCAPKASVSFEGETQAGGRSVHRLEVRRLAFVLPGTKEVRPTMSSCVIYYAGDEYGSSVLRQIDDCIDPLVRKLSEDRVEIYFLSGAHTHIRQRWSLLGHTARLETEEEISWCDDPRMPNKPDAANPAIASRFQTGSQRRGVADTGR